MTDLNEMKAKSHDYSTVTIISACNRGWIAVAKPLDREQHSKYKLTVRVTDGKHVGTHEFVGK